MAIIDFFEVVFLAVLHVMVVCYIALILRIFVGGK